MGEKRQRRSWSAAEKLQIVLLGTDRRALPRRAHQFPSATCFSI
jgi:transposase-like protein